MSEITQKELEAAGYGFVCEAAGWWVFILPDGIAHDGGYFALERARQAAREHYAPRKALAEAQARIAALEALVREVWERQRTDDEWGFMDEQPKHNVRNDMPADWRERAAKFVEISHDA